MRPSSINISAGRTLDRLAPNCNTDVKFEPLLRIWHAKSARSVWPQATTQRAFTEMTKRGRWELLRARDESKDPILFSLGPFARTAFAQQVPPWRTDEGRSSRPCVPAAPIFPSPKSRRAWNSVSFPRELCPVHPGVFQGRRYFPVAKRRRNCHGRWRRHRPSQRASMNFTIQPT